MTNPQFGNWNYDAANKHEKKAYDEWAARGGSFGDWMGGSGHWWGNGNGGGGSSDAPVPPYSGGVSLGVTPGAPEVSSRQAPGVNELIVYQLQGLAVARWELIIRDLSGGFDLQVAEIGPGSVPNLISDGTLYSKSSRTLTLPPKVDTDSTAANLMSTWKGAMHCVYLKNEFFAPIVGGGSTANKSLFKLDQVASGGTWEEDFTITPQTYSPPSAISSLSAVKIGGVLKDKILIGFADDPARIISEIDGTPTADGTMHANTEPCFGAYQSPLNSVTPGASTILMYANNGWWSLSSESGITAAPTRTLDKVNNGGFIIDAVEFNGITRLYYVEPIQDLAKTHMLDTNAATSGSPTALGRIMSINLEGSDPQKLDIGLDYVIWAGKWRNGIIATDGQEWKWHNGQQIVNLSWNRERSWSADAIVSCRAGVVDGERFYAQVVEVSAAASTTYLRWEEYVFEENAWYPVFEKHSLQSGRFAVFPRQAPILHYYDSATSQPAVHRLFYGVGLTSGDGITQWRSVPLWPASYNPYYSQSTGNIPRNFATTGTTTSPIYHFFEGRKKIVSDIQFLGDLKGTGAKVKVQIATEGASSMSFDASSQYAEFLAADRWDRHIAKFMTPAFFNRLQFRITGTGSSSTRQTSNFLPVMLGGYVMYDNEDRYPAELEAWRFE